MTMGRIWPGLFMAGGVIAIRYAPALPLLGDLAVTLVGFVVIALGVVLVKQEQDAE